MRGNIDLILIDFMFKSVSVRPQRQIKDKAPEQTGMLLLFLAGFIDHWTSCRAQHLRLFRERPFWEMRAESGFLLLETTNAPAGLPNVKLCLDQGCTHILLSSSVHLYRMSIFSKEHIGAFTGITVNMRIWLPKSVYVTWDQFFETSWSLKRAETTKWWWFKMLSSYLI